MSLASGPAGWALTPTADGYDVTGPPLAPGTDVEFGITIEQLPADATVLVFKTLVRYTDGAEDAWIEEPTADNPEPAEPGPGDHRGAGGSADDDDAVVVRDAPPRPRRPRPRRRPPRRRAPTTRTARPMWPWVVGAVLVVALAGGLAYWRFGSRSSRDSA